MNSLIALNQNLATMIRDFIFSEANTQLFFILFSIFVSSQYLSNHSCFWMSGQRKKEEDAM